MAYFKKAVLVTDYFLTVAVCICKEKFKVEIIEYNCSVSFFLSHFVIACLKLILKVYFINLSVFRC